MGGRTVEVFDFLKAAAPEALVAVDGDTKTYYFLGAPAPGNGCGQFTIWTSISPYAEKVGYKQGTCANQGYPTPNGSMVGNGGLPISLGLVGRTVEVFDFLKAAAPEALVAVDGDTKTYYFLGAPAPGNGCGHFTISTSISPYAEK